MRKIGIILLLVLFAGSMFGAFKGEAHEADKGIIAGEVEPSLTKKDPLVFKYEVKNQTEKKVELQFTSGQRYEYIIKNKRGKKIYTYSSDKSFMQALGTETIVQGESLAYDIDLTELKLKKGKYTLIVWMTPEDGKAFKVKKKFKVE